MQPDLFDMPSAPFQRSSPTSKAGAVQVQPKVGTQLASVLETIRDHGPVSDWDIVGYTGYALSVVNARRRSLVLDGFVRQVGTVIGPRKVLNAIWKVT